MCCRRVRDQHVPAYQDSGEPLRGKPMAQRSGPAPYKTKQSKKKLVLKTKTHVASLMQAQQYYCRPCPRLRGRSQRRRLNVACLFFSSPRWH